jgi:hypothetical protein
LCAIELTHEETELLHFWTTTVMNFLGKMEGARGNHGQSIKYYSCQLMNLLCNKMYDFVWVSSALSLPLATGIALYLLVC